MKYKTVYSAVVPLYPRYWIVSVAISDDHKDDEQDGT